MRDTNNREPLCPFCWAFRKIRHPLDFKPFEGYWECSLCLARAEHPSEDEESIREDLQRAHDEWLEERAQQFRYMMAVHGPPKRYRNIKSGRRKSAQPKRYHSKSHEAVAKAIEQHNAKVRKKAGLPP